MIDQFNVYLLLLVKFFFVLGAVIYAVFSTVIVKQTTSMSKNVNDKFNAFLIAFSYLHLVLSILLVIMTFLVL